MSAQRGGLALVRPAQPTAAARNCVRCGAQFTCGRDEQSGCWCAALPPLPALAVIAGADCLCPACLRAALAVTSAPG
jgi:hypothetical protein